MFSQQVTYALEQTANQPETTPGNPESGAGGNTGNVAGGTAVTVTDVTGNQKTAGNSATGIAENGAALWSSLGLLAAAGGIFGVFVRKKRGK